MPNGRSVVGWFGTVPHDPPSPGPPRGRQRPRVVADRLPAAVVVADPAEPAEWTTRQEAVEAARAVRDRLRSSDVRVTGREVVR